MNIDIKLTVHNLNAAPGETTSQDLGIWTVPEEEAYAPTEATLLGRLRTLLSTYHQGTILELSRPLPVYVEGSDSAEDDVSFFGAREQGEAISSRLVLVGFPQLARISDLETDSWRLKLWMDAWRVNSPDLIHLRPPRAVFPLGTLACCAAPMISVSRLGATLPKRST